MGAERFRKDLRGQNRLRIPFCDNPLVQADHVCRVGENRGKIVGNHQLGEVPFAAEAVQQFAADLCLL